MKKVSPLLKIAVLTVFSILIFSFSIDKKDNDTKLVGIWKGFEKDAQKRELKNIGYNKDLQMVHT